VGEVLDRAQQLRRALVGAEGDDPGDRNRGEADGQGAERCRGPAVGPLLIVEGDQDRAVERGALEHRLEVLEQPVALLGQGVELPQPGSLQHRLRAVEQRRHQRRELHDARAGLRSAGADPDREPSCDPRGLRQQAALAHAGLALDEHHAAGPGARAVELDTDPREFGVPATNDGSGREGVGQSPESTADSPAPDPAAVRERHRRHGTVMRCRRRAAPARCAPCR
jgi:hypothetical protein